MARVKNEPIKGGALAGAGEMSQSVKYPVKYVLCKPNDLSSNPQDPWEKLGMAALACSSSYPRGVLRTCSWSNGDQKIPEAHYIPQSAWSN